MQIRTNEALVNTTTLECPKTNPLIKSSLSKRIQSGMGSHPAWGANYFIYSLGISFTGNSKVWRDKCKSISNRGFVLRATTMAS